MIRVGVFDSGIGGLSVVQYLLSGEDSLHIEYYADSKHIPYGDKSPEFIKDRSEKICSFLYSKHVECIIVACNTATAIAIDSLRNRFKLRFIGIEPGIKPALKKTKTNAIAILATHNTIRSARFKKLIDENNAEQKYNFYLRAGNGLVEQVEKFQLDDLQLLHGHLDSCLINNVDTLVLGCTHYSYLKNEINNYLHSNGKKISIIDSSEAVGRHAIGLLSNYPHQQPKKKGIYSLSLSTTGEIEPLIKASEYLGLLFESALSIAD
ncbi:MAG: glutamate racemase [Methylacidiphilales bacterium]|nr:glutamate racemase [Candidatus Methylacidiphilales bacterium]